MMLWRFFIFLVVTMALAALPLAKHASAQTDALNRRAAGIRVGIWKVPEAGAEVTTYSSLPHFEGYFQRGMDRHIALESTAGVWRRTARTIQPLTGNVVETDTYIIPLFTSVKVFPVTTLEDNAEPFLLAGIGFALGIDDVSDNAIGGGGSSIATGFGFKLGAGIEYHLTDVFGIIAGGRYQWVSYIDALAGQEKFAGFGVEGGISYRFRF